MKIEELLPDLEPPPGGWMRLRERIEARESPSRRPRRLLLAAAVSAVVVIAGWLTWPGGQTRGQWLGDPMDWAYLGLDSDPAHGATGPTAPGVTFRKVAESDVVVVFLRTGASNID